MVDSAAPLDERVGHFMHHQLSHAERIAALKAEIQSLEQSALTELQDKRNALLEEIAAVDAEIEGLTGESTEKLAIRTRAPKRAGKQISFELLKTTLRELPGKTMNIRKEGYDSKQIKSLIASNPESLSLGGKGAWPTVSLRN
jgi:hypothetical protein